MMKTRFKFFLAAMVLLIGYACNDDDDSAYALHQSKLSDEAIATDYGKQIAMFYFMS